MSWIVFATLAPALYAASTFIDRFLVEKKIRDFLFLSILSGVVAFIAGMIIFVVRGFPLLNPVYAALILFSGVLYEIALVPYYHAISLEDASRVAPLFQVVPVFVLILSFFFLHEVPNIAEFIGFLLLIGGAFVLAREEGATGFFKVDTFFWYAMLAAFLYAVPGIIFKFILSYANFWDTLAYEFFGGAIGIIPLLFLRAADPKQDGSDIRGLSSEVWALIMSNELIYIIARFCTFYAILLAPVYLVAAVGSSGPVFVFLYGLALSLWLPGLIHEDLRRGTLIKKGIAIGVIVVGALLLNAGGI
ncbi:EamA family transporter [Patescibacteria group bacterium]|nr:EamA family transporter [Patescibacteria group bacterium]